MNAFLIVLVSVSFGGAFLYLITRTIVLAVREISKHRLDLEFKYRLIERGLSVNEVERLLDFEIGDQDHNHHDDYENNVPRPPMKQF